jgi:hypothetical protein
MLQGVLLVAVLGSLLRTGPLWLPVKTGCDPPDANADMAKAEPSMSNEKTIAMTNFFLFIIMRMFIILYKSFP